MKHLRDRQVRVIDEDLARTLRLVLDVYGDDGVIPLLAASFTSVLRRPLAFHLGQAGLSLESYREIARELVIMLEDGIAEIGGPGVQEGVDRLREIDQRFADASQEVTDLYEAGDLDRHLFAYGLGDRRAVQNSGAHRAKSVARVSRIMEQLGSRYVAEDWADMNETWFSALWLEKNEDWLSCPTDDTERTCGQVAG